MACSSSCYTQDHASYGACLRAKNLKAQVSVPGTGYDPAKNKAWDQRIDAYKDARSEGIQPKSSQLSDIKTAVRTSDATGSAFTAQ